MSSADGDPADAGPLPSITHLTDPDTFQGDQLTLSGPAYKHLFRSRRLPVGARLRIVDGLGAARVGEVVRIGKKDAELELGEALPSEHQRRRLHLKVGALRPERASWLVEKTTELGVSSITFVNTERTPRSYGDGRLDRLTRVAGAAVEQCGRARVPDLTGPFPWQDAVANLNPDTTFVMDGEGGSPWESRARIESLDLTLWIGPEGGFSESERRFFQDQGVAFLRLGEHILRVETAAVVATAALMLL